MPKVSKCTAAETPACGLVRASAQCRRDASINHARRFRSHSVSKDHPRLVRSDSLPLVPPFSRQLDCKDNQRLALHAVNRPSGTFDDGPHPRRRALKALSGTGRLARLNARVHRQYFIVAEKLSDELRIRAEHAVVEGARRQRQLLRLYAPSGCHKPKAIGHLRRFAPDRPSPR